MRRLRTKRPMRLCLSALVSTGCLTSVAYAESVDVNVQALERLVERYETLSTEYDAELKQQLERTYAQSRDEIETRYATQLTPTLKKESDQRKAAIEVFERFIKRHPDVNPETPDAMFRLAELYFEADDAEHQLRMTSFKDEFDAWLAAGSNGEPPLEPTRQFNRSIALYQKTLANFPGYTLNDAVYYLLGYTLTNTEQDDAGMEAWRNLVAQYPTSRFAPEVWFRIADLHFDYEEWDQALLGFSKVLELGEGKFYDKALYKSAWTHYLVSDYDRAVAQFFELLDYSEKKKAETGEPSGSVLEEEAIQYVAISFTDDGWRRPNVFRREATDDDISEFNYVTHVKSYFADTNTRRINYARPVAAKVGEMLFAQAKNIQAIEAYRWAIELDPLNPDAPRYQDMIVQAFERDRNFAEASKERALLVARYGDGSEWANTNKLDTVARYFANDAAKSSLYKAAVFYHQQANTYLDASQEELAYDGFSKAAESYGRYIELYPRDPETYNLKFYLAETQYYSKQYEAAAKSYAWVRDTDLGQEHRAASGLGVIYALLKLDDALQVQNKLEPLPRILLDDAPEPTEEELTRERTKRELPSVRLSYVKAVDRYLERAPNDANAPAFGYRTAALFYGYGQFDEANKRFEELIERYPETEVARFAANYILDNLLAQEKWDEAAKYASLFQSKLKDSSGTFAKIEGGAKFQLAKDQLERGDALIKSGKIDDGIALLEQGASSYLTLIDADPKREFADVMMYNAALSYEKARRPVKASSLYERLVNEYPQSEFASESLFRVATKAEQAFQFDKAVRSYRLLVSDYLQSERRVDAQVNLGLLLESMQQYEQAAKEFERFSTLFPEREDASTVFYRAAVVFNKQNDAAQEANTLRRFVARYKNSAVNTPKVIEALARLGEIADDNAQLAKRSKDRQFFEKKAQGYWSQAKTLLARDGGSPNSKFYAAKAVFLDADQAFRAYDRLKLDARQGKQQQKQFQMKIKRLASVEQAMKSVIQDYKQAEWSLAAFLRIGGLYDGMQKAMFAAPCPDDVEAISLDACDEYLVQLEERGYQLEEKAIQAYKIVVERSEEWGIQSEWTTEAHKSLNLLSADQFPLDKEPVADLAFERVSLLAAYRSNGGADDIKRIRDTVNDVSPRTKTAATTETSDSTKPQASEPESANDGMTGEKTSAVRQASEPAEDEQNDESRTMKDVTSTEKAEGDAADATQASQQPAVESK